MFVWLPGAPMRRSGRGRQPDVRSACHHHITTRRREAILDHTLYGASKVGITGRYTREDRPTRFENGGWRVIDKLPFVTGREARKTEHAVINTLRPEGRRKKEGFLTPAQMPAGGWTETFDATTVPASLPLSMAQGDSRIAV
ncbi:hypothetical protein AB0A71_30270 [Kitasatospora aureofaciens]|uniref:hypothetical protein n=1 Tax=Kitasatospora aureofaciens TaxID=1894 RepID=UPI0033F94499